MGLTHVHSKDGKGLPKLDKMPWTAVSAKKTVISETGATLLVADFSGCLAVVMTGKGKWSVVSHMHQLIQHKSQSLTRALALVADFVRKEMKDDITDVLLYYGDAGENLGQKQIEKKAHWLTAPTVKQVMGCKGTVIDLRRTEPDDTYGNDFVYDPSKKKFYTAPGGAEGLMAQTLVLQGNPKELKNLRFAKFPFDKDMTKEAVDSVEQMASGGYSAVM